MPLGRQSVPEVCPGVGYPPLMSPGGPTPQAPTPAASVSLDFERPVAAVRALLFDVDLTVRTRIHRGVRVQWLPSSPAGERRVRQQTHVLDRMQDEEFVIEEGAAGTWVKRFVSGPNVGSSFVGTFEPEGDALTRVRLSAFVGPRGFAQGLGKLSPIGLEKSMKRLLGEYKRALVGYEPGRARGAVLGVAAGWTGPRAAMKRLDAAKQRTLMATLLETAWSTAALDDEVDEAERDAMKAVVAALWDTGFDPAMEERMVRAAADAIRAQGVEARCGALGAKLKALGFAELGVAIAVLVAEVSRGLDPSELLALRHLASAAGLGEAELAALVRRTDDELSGVDAASRVSMFV
jgi:tellurite resistance protein